MSTPTLAFVQDGGKLRQTSSNVTGIVAGAGDSAAGLAGSQALPGTVSSVVRHTAMRVAADEPAGILRSTRKPKALTTLCIYIASTGKTSYNTRV